MSGNTLFALAAHWSNQRAMWLKRAANGGTFSSSVARCVVKAEDAENRVIHLAALAQRQLAQECKGAAA